MGNEKITKSRIERLSPPQAGQAFVRDSVLQGFAVRVTAAGVKSFIVEKRIDGRVKRITLRRYPELTVEQARKEAHKILGKIASGVNPIAEKKDAELRAITLTQAFDDFKAARKNLKSRTLYDYDRVMRVAFPDWKDKALAAINKDMVAKRHAQLGAHHGKAYANLSMRFLRALVNFASAQYEDGFGQPDRQRQPRCAPHANARLVSGRAQTNADQGAPVAGVAPPTPPSEPARMETQGITVYLAAVDATALPGLFC